MSLCPEAAYACRLENEALPCPRCGQESRSLKRCRVFDSLAFRGLTWAARWARYVACPACMRQVLWARSLRLALPANLLWPLVLLCHGFAFVATFPKGHSRGVLRVLRGEE